MAVSEALFSALAEALSKPSKNYQALQTAFQIPDAGIKGYREGAGLADEIRKRKLQSQTLGEVLGASAPPELANLPADQAEMWAKPVEAAAAYMKATREPHENGSMSQGLFQYNGMLTRWNKNTGDYDALTPEGWKTIGTPVDLPSGGGKGRPSTIGSIPTGGTVEPRIPPTTPAAETDFFAKADTLGNIFKDIRKSYKPDYVGPIAGPVGRGIDVYTPFGNPDRSHFRNQVAKAFNNLIYLRSGKQINEEEGRRMAEEFMKTNNSPVAFMSALDSMESEMKSLAMNKRKALVQAGYRGAAGLGDGHSSDSTNVVDTDPLGLFK